LLRRVRRASIGINQIYLRRQFRPQRAPLSCAGTRSAVYSEAIKLTPGWLLRTVSGETIRAMFLEVDMGTEALSVWQQKAANYLQLAVSGNFKSASGSHSPGFWWLPIERRLHNIRSTSPDPRTRFSGLQVSTSLTAMASVTSLLRPTGDQRNRSFEKLLCAIAINVIESRPGAAVSELLRTLLRLQASARTGTQSPQCRNLFMCGSRELSTPHRGIPFWLVR